MPAQIRKRFKLGVSSRLQWMVEGDLITVLPIPQNPARVLKGAMKGRVSFKKFIDDRRLDREGELSCISG